MPDHPPHNFFVKGKCFFKNARSSLKLFCRSSSKCFSRRRAEYAFGEHGFKHRAQWRVPDRELSEFLSAFYLCDKANSPSFLQNSLSLPQNSVRLSEFSSPKQYSRNSIPLPFPIFVNFGMLGSPCRAHMWQQNAHTENTQSVLLGSL